VSLFGFSNPFHAYQGGVSTHNAPVAKETCLLNCANCPVRTRMLGGVGGDRSGNLTAPIPMMADNRATSPSLIQGYWGAKVYRPIKA
jgi:hypothetical protein